MKKRSLFLSLICSVVLTIALTTFTIISVIPKKADGNGNGQTSTNVSNVSDPAVIQDLNADRDGSKELPYLIYDVASYDKYIGGYGYTEVKPLEKAVLVPVQEQVVDAEGNVTYVDVVDAEGNIVVTEKLDENGQVVTEQVVDADGNVLYNDTCYFEIAEDIDFSGVEYKTLYNQDKPFNGHINGKGHSLKNISINVNTSNFRAFVYKNTENKDRYDANIALFGTVEDAEIVDVKVDDMSVVVEDEVYAYVANGGFFNDYEQNAMNEIRVGTVAAVAKNSTISVDVKAQIKAAAYTLVLDDEPQGNSSIGGVVGLAIGSKIENTNVNVKFIAAKTGVDESYFVGGIAGQAYYTEVLATNIALDAETTYTNGINIGGAFGYIVDVKLQNANITLNVKENETRGSFKNFSTKGYDHTTSSWVAGIAPKMKAAENEKIEIADVKVQANVVLDAVYAGAVVEVSASSVEGNIKFKNVIVNSNVDVVEAFGFARYLGVATVEYDENAFVVDENNREYQVKLTGKVILENSYDKGYLAVSAFEKDFVIAGKAATIKIVVADAIYNKLLIAEKNYLSRIDSFVIC